ncbi:MAG: hypothetical protein AAGI49_06795 [Bacteroidota bacterium]
MSFLLDKSEQNKIAFSYLFDKDVYAAITHCAYYSCIQKIIYILSEYYTDEYNAGLEQIKGSAGNRHLFYIKEIYHWLSKDKIVDSRSAINFKRMLIELRNSRIEADYYDVEITAEKAEKVKDTFEEIQLLIKRSFSL